MAITFVAQYTFPLTDGANTQGATLTLDKDATDAAANAIGDWPAAPTGDLEAGDFILVAVQLRAQGGTCSATTTGGQTWAELFDGDSSGGAMNHAVYWCIFNGTWDDDPVFTFADDPNANLMWAVALRGVDQADPIDVALADQGESDNDFVIADYSTNTDGAWAVVIAGHGNDNTATVDNSFAAPGGGNIYWRSVGGQDGAIGMAVKEVAAAGAVGETTWVWSVSNLGYAIRLAIKPAGDDAQEVTGAALSVTPSLPAGSVNHALTGVALSTTPTLPAGSAQIASITGATLQVTPTLPPGSVTAVVTGAALSVTPTLPAGRIDHSLTGVALSATPELPPGSAFFPVLGVALTITPTLPAARIDHTLTGAALEITPTLPAGAAGAILGGVALSATPTFPTARIDHTLTGAALEITPTLPAGAVTALLTGVTLSVSPTLPAGQLDLTVTGVALSASPALPAATLRHELAGATLTITPTLPAGSLLHSLVGATVTITPTLPAGSITHELTGVVLAVVPTLPAGEVAVGLTQITGAVLVIAPALPQGTVIGGRTARFDDRGYHPRFGGRFLLRP